MSGINYDIDYDPNKKSLINESCHSVRLVFGIWKYRHEVTERIGGNCMGMTVIEAAIGAVYDKLPEIKGTDIPFIILTDKDGNTLECADDDEDGEDFLKDMLMLAEIVEFDSAS